MRNLHFHLIGAAQQVLSADEVTGLAADYLARYGATPETVDRLTEEDFARQERVRGILLGEASSLNLDETVELAHDGIAATKAFFRAVQGEMCLKARRGGYDGNGVWFPKSEDEAAELVGTLLEAGTLLMAEKKVALVRELSAMVARTPSGVTQPWLVVESVQTDGICTEAIAPAPGLSTELQQQAQDLAVTIASELGVTGVLAVELFETTDVAGQPEILVNELAMRPHNTGHWSQDGCVTSQFEQHLRAVLDLPLGAVTPLAPYTVMANTLGAEHHPEMPMAQRVAEVMRKYPEAKIHLYGKGYRAGRKLGHVNVCGDDVEAARRAAKDAAHFIVNATWL